MQIVQLAQFTQFEWDENKAESNVLKHHVTFDDASVALRRPHLEKSSNRSGEHRILATCPHTDMIIAVIYTPRGEKCRIISARPAKKHEQRAYRLVFYR